MNTAERLLAQVRADHFPVQTAVVGRLGALVRGAAAGHRHRGAEMRCNIFWG